MTSSNKIGPERTRIEEAVKEIMMHVSKGNKQNMKEKIGQKELEEDDKQHKDKGQNSLRNITMQSSICK